MSVRECGDRHKLCVKWNVKKCRIVTERERRHTLRALGHNGRVSEGRTLAGYEKKIKRVKLYHKLHPEGIRATRIRTRAKYKELFGGRPDQSWSARVKWMEARQ